jgi:hypothetical protein
VGKLLVLLVQGGYLGLQSRKVSVVVDDVIRNSESGVPIGLAVNYGVDLCSAEPIALTGALLLLRRGGIDYQYTIHQIGPATFDE